MATRFGAWQVPCVAVPDRSQSLDQSIESATARTPRRRLDSGPAATCRGGPAAGGAAEVELEYRRAAFESAAARVKRTVQPATWSAFWETMVVGRSCESVAAELGIAVGAVYVARSRVIARLRTVAEELEAKDDA